MAAVESPIDMEAFENAVHEWFSTNTGLMTIWRQSSSPQPERPYGSLLRVAGPVAISPHWEVRASTDLSREAGKEIAQEACVPCRITISCQAHVAQPDGSNPNQNAEFYINKAQSSLSLPSVGVTFKAANISVLQPGEVQNLNQIVEDSFESRANIDVIFGASLSLTEYVGYIKTVQVKSTALGIDETVGDI